MRAHGVPRFPDPDAAGSFSVVMAADGSVQVNGTSFSGPKFQNAEKICHPFGGASRNPPVPASVKRQDLAFAECMRRHGLTRWADPSFPASGGIFGGGGPYSDSDPRVVTATQACNRLTGSG